MCRVTTESPSATTPPAASAPAPSGAGAPSPGPAPTRYRCAACGNLTRFDVVTNRRTKAFHHFSVGGELTVDEVEVLDETVEGVSCRWCGNGNAIEVLEDASPEAG